MPHTSWIATTAFATGPHPTIAEAAEVLRDRGATRLVIAPWFLAHGRITDRIAEFARAQRIPMAEPRGGLIVSASDRLGSAAPPFRPANGWTGCRTAPLVEDVTGR